MVNSLPRVVTRNSLISLCMFSLCLPMTVLGQAPDSQTGVPSLDDLEKRLEQQKAEQERRKQQSQPPVAGQDSSSDTPTPQAPSSPRFAGTWESVGTTLNGVAQTRFTPQRITITQDGPMVRIGNRSYRATSSNIITYQQSYAHDAQHGHLVQNADEADLVDTITWRIEGQKLVLKTVFDYRSAYFSHPAGRDVRITEYRRVAP
jgi:hypothetical protein